MTYQENQKDPPDHNSKTLFHNSSSYIGSGKTRHNEQEVVPQQMGTRRFAASSQYLAKDRMEKVSFKFRNQSQCINSSGSFKECSQKCLNHGSKDLPQTCKFTHNKAYEECITAFMEHVSEWELEPIPT